MLVAFTEARGPRIRGTKGYPLPYGHFSVDDPYIFKNAFAGQCTSGYELDGENGTFFFGYGWSDNWTENLIWADAGPICGDFNSSRSNRKSSVNIVGPDTSGDGGADPEILVLGHLVCGDDELPPIGPIGPIQPCNPDELDLCDW